MRLVVFDVDGTLIDSQAHILFAMQAAFEGLGLPVPPRAECLSVVGLSLPQAMARLAPGLGATDQARLMAGYKDGFAAARADVPSPLYPGAAELLERLSARADVRLGIATGKSRRGLEHVLASHDWGKVFHTVQVADDHPSKPHPSMLHAALAETGADPRHAVMVGDTEFDMQMAHAAGMQGIGVAWGYHPPVKPGARVVTSFAALEPALHAIWDGAAS